MFVYCYQGLSDRELSYNITQLKGPLLNKLAKINLIITRFRQKNDESNDLLDKNLHSGIQREGRTLVLHIQTVTLVGGT